MNALIKILDLVNINKISIVYLMGIVTDLAGDANRCVQSDCNQSSVVSNFIIN